MPSVDVDEGGEARGWAADAGAVGAWARVRAESAYYLFTE
jgi:hypothetical protein